MVMIMQAWPGGLMDRLAGMHRLWRERHDEYKKALEGAYQQPETAVKKDQ